MSEAIRITVKHEYRAEHSGRVLAEVIGMFAIHPSQISGLYDSQFLTITHVPTGLRVMDVPNREQALYIIDTLLGCGVDWTRTNPAVYKADEQRVRRVVEKARKTWRAKTKEAGHAA